MNIVFFCTSASRFSPGTFRITRRPSLCEEMEELARRNPGHSLFVVAQLPSLFLADMLPDGTLRKAPSVSYVEAGEADAGQFCSLVLGCRPDVAVAASIWSEPFDWHCLADSMVADMLRRHGVRVVCHPPKTMLTCFDKTLMEQFLSERDFLVPRSVHIRHELFWSERADSRVRENVYKEYVLSQVRDMEFPVVIKDVTGLSSYGTEVATTFAEAVHCLRSGKTRSDRMVQRYVDGMQFGTEIYGSGGRYAVLPPLAFSVNRFGITSPKQGIKAGPVRSEGFCLDELYAMLLRLADGLELCGAAQVDLVFSDGRWHILEVNPRLSGMTETYMAAFGITVGQMLLSLALGENPFGGRSMRPVCNFKAFPADEGTLDQLMELPFVRSVRQAHNIAARQEREKGYCEIVLCPDDGSTVSLGRDLDELAAKFPGIVDAGLLDKAHALLERTMRGVAEKKHGHP